MVGVKKEKPGKARLLILRCLPGAVLSGLSDGWGSLSTQEIGAGWSKDGREYFGIDLALAQHILGLPANQMSPCPPRPRGRLTLLCPLEANAGYAGGTPRHPLHGTSQTRAQVTCGETFWCEVAWKQRCWLSLMKPLPHNGPFVWMTSSTYLYLLSRINMGHTGARRLAQSQSHS